MIERNETELTLEDHQKASTEISFLLDIFASTVDDLMGGATATVGRIAGRHMGKKLPLYMKEPNVEDILNGLQEQFGEGFEFTFEADDSGADMTFKHCALRDVCRERNLELGGEICRMFHFAIGGVVNELMGRPAKASITSTGDTCESRLLVR